MLFLFCVGRVFVVVVVLFLFVFHFRLCFYFVFVFVSLYVFVLFGFVLTQLLFPKHPIVIKSRGSSSRLPWSRPARLASL